MTNYPIAKQEGLPDEILESMKPVEQKFTGDSGAELALVDYTGTASQKDNIASNIHSILVTHEKNTAKLDSKDEYATNNELESMSDNLSNFMCKVVKTAKVSVTTDVKTDSTLVGTITNVQSGSSTAGKLLGKGEGTGKSTSVIID